MKTRLTSLDRHVAATCEFVAPDRHAALTEAMTITDSPIPRGAGLSYVAAGFAEGGTSIGLTAFDRILNFDPAERTLEVEAGARLGKLFDFLTPRGLTLPVQPGYPAVTIGGCIAANVHGKNHVREGVFGRHVASLRLFHPRHGMVEASPEQNPDIFALTLGGLGLTGYILSAVLRLAPLRGNAVEQTHHPLDSLEDAFEQVGRMKEEADMLYAWLDLSRPSYPLGRGYLVKARYLEAASLPPEPNRKADLDPQKRDFRRIPLLNRFSIPWINRAYRFNALRRAAAGPLSLRSFLFPALGRESYFHAHGKAGFLEQQILLPAETVPSYLEAFRTAFRRHDVPSMLTTLKVFGGGRREFLHYDGDGYSFTIDLPNTSQALALMAELDEINCDHGAITAVVKDSRLPAPIAQRQYGEGMAEFREKLRAYDPARLFRSALSERLGL